MFVLPSGIVVVTESIRVLSPNLRLSRLVWSCTLSCRPCLLRFSFLCVFSPTLLPEGFGRFLGKLLLRCVVSLSLADAVIRGVRKSLLGPTFAARDLCVVLLAFFTGGSKGLVLSGIPTLLIESQSPHLAYSSSLYTTLHNPGDTFFSTRCFSRKAGRAKHQKSISI